MRVGASPGQGNLVCATVHLSFFGAMWEGFLGALECSQASLLAYESYEESPPKSDTLPPHPGGFRSDFGEIAPRGSRPNENTGSEPGERFPTAVLKSSRAWSGGSDFSG